MAIRGTTRVIAILGDPVAHSRSPAMHNAAFAHLGLDYVYVPLRVDAAELAHAVAAIRALGLVGVNVTVPHKEGVVALLDSVSPAARAAGAVNTIVNRGGHLHGENSDGVGFVRALREVGRNVRGKRVLVIGAGGAARGVVAALVAAGTRRVVVVNRTVQRAQQLARRFRGGTSRLEVAGLDDLTSQVLLGDVDIVVNATAVGLHRERFPTLRHSLTPVDCLFYDLLYGRDTDFLRRARRARRPTLDGSTMLLHQGAAAFTLWTGRRAPLAVMARALGK